MNNGYFLTYFISYTFCVFVRIASTGQFYKILKTYVFLKNNFGIPMQKYTIRLFWVDQIDVITNYAVITNVVIKTGHYIFHLSTGTQR